MLLNKVRDFHVPVAALCSTGLGVNDFARLASVYLRQEIAHTADEILDVCQNFIVCEGKAQRPRFVHLSVREFLEDLVEMGGDAGRITSFTAEEGNAAVSSACLLL
jgi:hypothetical protein